MSLAVRNTMARGMYSNTVAPRGIMQMRHLPRCQPVKVLSNPKYSSTLCRVEISGLRGCQVTTYHVLGRDCSWRQRRVHQHPDHVSLMIMMTVVMSRSASKRA